MHGDWERQWNRRGCRLEGACNLQASGSSFASRMSDDDDTWVRSCPPPSAVAPLPASPVMQVAGACRDLHRLARH